jgi:hypothetical protein
LYGQNVLFFTTFKVFVEYSCVQTMSSSTEDVDTATRSDDAMDTEAYVPWNHVILTEEEFAQVRHNPIDLVSRCDEILMRKLQEERVIASDRIAQLQKENEYVTTETRTLEEFNNSKLNALEQKTMRVKEERDAALKRNEELEARIQSLGLLIMTIFLT